MENNTAQVIDFAAAQSPDAQLAEMVRRMAQLEAENAALRAQKGSGRSLSFKVSEKGAVSVYGLQRFPVTLYRESWQKLFAAKDSLEKFIADNKQTLDAVFAQHQAK